METPNHRLVTTVHLACGKNDRSRWRSINSQA